MSDDYKEIYNSSFKHIVEDKNGKLIKDQVMRILATHYQFMQIASDVYQYVTGGVIVNVNEPPHIIKRCADDHYMEVKTELASSALQTTLSDRPVASKKENDRLQAEVDRLQALLAEIEHRVNRPL